MEQHLLVPVDGSTHAEKAVDFALTYHPDSDITLIHVIASTSYFAYSDEDYFDLEEFQREEERRREFARSLLDKFVERARDRGVDVETVIEAGRPARTILAVADDQEVDHIVMGSRGRSGVGRVLFGSVAETVTRRSPVPVTIVR